MYNNKADAKVAAGGGNMLFLGDAEIFRSAFNQSAADLKIAQLTEDMAQAFYRREHDTINFLSAQGAKFTPEMLHAAVGFRDHHLTDKCLQAGVIPDEDAVKTAVNHKDAPLTAMLIQRMTPTPALKTYIENHATDAVKKAAAPALQRMVPEP
jgi:hypothetical protein